MNKILILLIGCLLVLFQPNAFAASQQVAPKPPESQTIQQIHQFNTHSPNASPEEEAKWTANQYQSLSNAIKEDKGKGVIQGQSIFNMSIFTQIKNIVDAITVQTNNLVELIMPGKPQTTETQAKVNTIVNSLDAQRKTLSTYISGNQNPAPAVQFDPSKFDRPKEKTTAIFSK